jgi:multidrug efflux pump subunit AcrA (membrane-fusion protein)
MIISQMRLNRRVWFRTRFNRRGTGGIGSFATVLVLLLATGSGVWWWVQRSDAPVDANIMLHPVARSDFELTITERGEIESFDVTEVRSLVKSNNTSGSAILRIVTEGTEVNEGDFLVELDASALAAQRTTQKIVGNAAKAAEVEAHNTYETAVIAKREYLEGTYLQERQTIESEVFVAEENLNRAKEYYAYSQKLASKGYVNELQLEADRFAVEKAKKDLDTAKTKLHVLDEFTKPKMLSTLESAILIADAKWESSKNSYELEQEKLQEIEDQIAKCTIVAPQAGVVKYAHETDRRGDQEFVVEEGAIVRERQPIIRLPNADSMQVELNINESLIQYVRPGLPAIISPVGFGDRTLRGKVIRVNQYAEPTGWRQANVKEYKAYVSIDTASAELRSGMTASVTIRCTTVRDALQVPVQALYSHGSQFYCFVHDGGRWEAREITAGPTNDKFFVIDGGLQEGEQVAMNPRRFVDQVTLPKLSPEETQRAVPIASTEGMPSEELATANAGGPNMAAGFRPGGGPPGGQPGPGGGVRRGPDGAGGENADGNVAADGSVRLGQSRDATASDAGAGR